MMKGTGDFMSSAWFPRLIAGMCSVGFADAMLRGDALIAGLAGFATGVWIMNAIYHEG